MAAITSLRDALQGHQVADRQPVVRDETLRLDDNDRPVRGLLAALLSRRAIDGRNPVPAMDNLLDADGAVSPERAVAPAEDPRSGLTR